MQEVRGRVDRANTVVKYLCGVSRGLEVNTSLMLYKSLVRSITDYGCFVYHPKVVASQTKLERAQYKGIRTALGYRNTTPNNVIVAEAKVRLLRDRAEMLARGFVCETVAYDVTGLCDKMRRMYESEMFVRYRQPTYRQSLLSRIWKDFGPFRPLLGRTGKHEVFRGVYEAHSFKPTIDFIGLARKADVNYTDDLLIGDVLTEYELNQSAEIIYTDGSRDSAQGATGVSIVLEGQDLAYKVSLHKYCSSFTAEVFAIKSALELMVMQRDRRDSHIVIVSDCKSALSAVENNLLNVHKNRYVTEAWRHIFALERFHDKKVVLVWIPAHVGIAGNKLADELAKEAAREEPNPDIEVPVGDLKAVAKEETWKSTQAEILRDSAHKGSFYFERFYDETTRKPWFSKINAERYFVTLMNRLRANHHNLKVSLKRKGYVDSERCECGNEREDLNHVLLQCSKYDDLRIKMYEELRAVDYHAEIDLYDLIKNERWSIVYIIFNFFKRIGKVI